MRSVSGSGLRSAIFITIWLAFTAALMPLQLIALCTSRRAARAIPRFYHRNCARLLGARIECVGTPSAARPTLFVSNHVSWVDIIVLSAVLDVSFIAKREVRSWPLFGWLAQLQRTVFVARNPRKVTQERDDIARRLADGDDLVLFAEGTSSPGTGVLPFKSALFAVAHAGPETRGLTVQPVSISYVRLAGMPIGRQWRDSFAWYGDMDLLPHFWQVFGIGRFIVRLYFHPAVQADQFKTRKALAQHCESLVAAGVAAAHGGVATLPTDLPRAA